MQDDREDKGATSEATATEATALERQLVEAKEDIAAIVRVLGAVTGATTVLEAAKAALDGVRRELGWGYGSYWKVDPAEGVLRFAVDSGEVGEAFRKVTTEATFVRGVGFNGRTWAQGSLLFVKDIGALSDCSRAPAARALGVRSGVCFPIEVRGEIVGTMDFFVTEEIDLGEGRMEVLRAVAQLVSVMFTQVRDAEEAREVAASADAVNRVLSALSGVTTAREAIQTALDAVRSSFGWAYGSYWALDRERSVLTFALDSGDVSEEFRSVTMQSTFTRGVGFNGRTWQRGELFFVKDIADMTDCSRAPAARRGGVRSGVCFPITIRNEFVGTMDFFVMETIVLAKERIAALRNVADLVSVALGRVEAIERERTNAKVFRTAMSKLAAKLSAVSASLSDMTRTQATISQNQATSIAELSTTTTELRQMALQSMEKAQSVIGVSDRALAGASEGRAAVEGSLRGMDDIRANVQQIAAKIAPLNEHTKQIGEIIVSVREIAEQSRLLALNAAMEAARAGEHGRGFSVVATEIRALANQSKESTLQVGKILGEFKQSTEAAAVAMEAGMAKVETGVALASRAGERIDVLNTFVEEALDAARLIANAARVQGVGVSQAAEAIAVINRDTTAAVDVMKRAESMARDLTQTVHEITALVGDFSAED